MSTSSQATASRTITPVLLIALVSTRHVMAAGLYAIAAVACATVPTTASDRPRAPAASPTPATPRQRLVAEMAHRPWSAVAAMLATLAVVRAFDLPRHVGNSFRRVAYSEGWYERRRPLQTALVIVAIVAMCFVAAALVRATQHYGRELRAAIVAVSMLIALAALRTISLHDIDGMLARHDRFVIVAEAGGLAMIILAALGTRRASCDSC